MPRLISTLSRILKFIFISWFSLISLWIFLPSPAITPPGTTTQTRYVQQTLVDSGRVLHTIYLWDESFDVASVTILPANTLYPGSPRQRARVSSGGADSTHLLVDWRLSHHSSNKHDARNDIVILGMGRDVRYQLNLTDAVMKVQSHNDEEDPDLIRISEEDGNDENDEIVYVGDQVTVQVDEGGADHIINMPWFHLPDAALFHNQMHGFTRDIHIRVVARYLKAETKTVVEIWKSAPVTEWLRLRWEKKYGWPIDGLAANNNDDGLDGEYYVKNIFRSDESHYYSSGLLASFVNVYNPHDVSTAEDLQVTIRGDAQLPSRTYWIRSMILVPLAPSLMIAFSLWLILIYFLSFLICYEILALVAFYCVAVLVCWLVYDLRRRRRRRDSTGEKTEISHEIKEMSFLEWFSEFWLTRYVYAFLAYCCCCCCCCYRSKRRGGGYRSDEKWGGKRIVIWGPAGPVYEDVINR